MAEGVGDDGDPGDGSGPDVDLVTLQPGQTISRYRVVAVLGQGGFGITYRAVDAELGRQVAIKEYLPAALAIRKDGITVVPRSRGAAADLAWGLERFVSEGRTLAALQRAPGIVKVHDFLQANGTAYLVMELVDGETLDEHIRRAGPLDAAAVDRILAPLLDGLEQVHAAGFLHRDIKPANILLDDLGRPTLIDFGASRAAVAGRTQAMTAVFTPGYAPVEQFTSAAQGAWTDIYSLAATLYHAITGDLPDNAIDRMVDDRLVPLAGSGRAFANPLLAAIDAALVVRASDRPQSVAAWRALLSGPAASPATVVMPAKAPTGAPQPPATVAAPVATPVVAPVVAPVTGASAARPRGQGTGLKIAAVAAALLLVAAGGWWTLGSGSLPPASSPSLSSAPSSPAPPVVAAAPVVPDRAQQELEQARREQRVALEEAARLRAEAEARRKADEEAALRARIEQEVRDKAAAEEAARQKAAADAKLQTEAEAAAKAKADAEAAAKAQEEAAARQRAVEADRKGAEAAETALRLGQLDRQRIQVALTALGFTTGGIDGVFGARSREMIADWQKKAGHAATGFLTQDQLTALLREAAPAVARYDEEQKKLAQTPAPPPPAAPAAPPSSAPASPPSVAAAPPAPAAGGQCEGTYRSQWCRGAYQGFPPNCWSASMTIRNGEISDGWASQADASQRNVVRGRIDAAGNVSLTFNGIGQQTHVNQQFVALMSGRVVNGLLTAAGRAGASGRDFNVTVRCR